MAGQRLERNVQELSYGCRVQEVTGGLLSIGGGMFSRGYKIQPPRYGMTEGEFKDLLNVADYSKAKDSTPTTSKNTAALSRSERENIWLRLVRVTCRARAGRLFQTLAQS
jgi:hypothetical protein